MGYQMTHNCDRCRQRSKVAQTPTGALLCAACMSLDRLTAGKAAHRAPRRGAAAKQTDAFAGRDVRGQAKQLDIFGDMPFSTAFAILDEERAGRDALRDGR